MPLFLSLLLWLLPAPRHSYHASLTELRYNATGPQLEISIKVFTNDFEKALSKGQPKPLHLDAPDPQVGLLTAAYLQQHLQFSAPGGGVQPVQFLGSQPEKDAHWLYCKVQLLRPLRSLQIRNTVLLDVFADQSNVVNLEADGKKLSVLFRAGHEQEVVKW